MACITSPEAARRYPGNPSGTTRQPHWKVNKISKNPGWLAPVVSVIMMSGVHFVEGKMAKRRRHGILIVNARLFQCETSPVRNGGRSVRSLSARRKTEMCAGQACLRFVKGESSRARHSTVAETRRLASKPVRDMADECPRLFAWQVCLGMMI